MTDRYNALVVVLDREMRSDDAEATINAIGMIKGVLSVTPNIVDIGSYTAEMHAKRILEGKILDIFKEDIW